MANKLGFKTLPTYYKYVVLMGFYVFSASLCAEFTSTFEENNFISMQAPLVFCMIYLFPQYALGLITTQATILLINALYTGISSDTSMFCIRLIALSCTYIILIHLFRSSRLKNRKRPAHFALTATTSVFIATCLGLFYARSVNLISAYNILLSNALGMVILFPLISEIKHKINTNIFDIKKTNKEVRKHLLFITSAIVFSGIYFNLLKTDASIIYLYTYLFITSIAIIYYRFRYTSYTLFIATVAIYHFTDPVILFNNKLSFLLLGYIISMQLNRKYEAKNKSVELEEISHQIKNVDANENRNNVIRFCLYPEDYDIDYTDNMLQIMEIEPGTRLNFHQILDMIHAEDREILMHNVNMAITTGKKVGCSYRAITTTGKTKVFHATGTFGRDKKTGKMCIEGEVVYIPEISYEPHIHIEGEESLQFIIDSFIDLVIIINKAGHIEHINKAAIKHIGKDISAITGTKLHEHLYGKSRETISQITEEVLLTGLSDKIEIYSFSRWHEFILSPLKNTDKHLTGIVFIGRDSTERKQYAQVLDKITSQLKEAERIANIGYWEWDYINDRMYWSRQTYNIFGIEPQNINLTKSNILKLVSNRDKKGLSAFLDSFIGSKSSEKKRYEFRINNPDGKERHCMLRVEHDISSYNPRLFIIIQDITELKKFQLELLEAKEVAEKANRAKTEFLASASHDLRQPLQALNMFVEALSYEDLKDNQKKLLDKIVSSSSALKNLLDNLLEISQIESANIEVKKNDFVIGYFLEQLFHEYQETAKNKNLDCKFVFSSAVVNTDPILFERIIRNLVSNAIKYTPTGGKILLGCRAKKGSLEIYVCDTGIGIDKEKITTIFEAFKQINNPERNLENGVGLGLSIVRKIAQILELNINVSSSPEKGSIFSVVLPYNGEKGSRPMLKIAQKSLDLPKEKGKSSIVIVEDNNDIRNGLKSVLEKHYDNVNAYRNGIQAIRTETSAPSIMLVDYRLEDEENGIDVVNAIRSQFNTNIPAIIITGEMIETIREEAEANSCYILQKPINSFQLIDAINNHLVCL